MIKRKDSDNDANTKGGHMFRDSDWRDIEITCYIYIEKDDNDDNFAWFARGGYQGGNAFQNCSSCKYSANLYYESGRFGVNKKTKHGDDNKRNPGDDKLQTFGPNLGDMRGKWFGYKAIYHNGPSVGTYPNSGNAPIFPVKIEIWVDRVDNEESDNFIPKNQWQKKMETWDNPKDNNFGKWPESGQLCGAPEHVTLSWGGPVVTFRIDKNSNNDPWNDFKLKFVSIREINPGEQIFNP